MSARGSGEKSGIVVVVPTTAGAIEVMGLRWSQKIPSSRVVLGNETADQCERWTKEYNSLLRPGDPMRALLGLHEAGGYRLVVSAEIDHGRSWMMPVSAAHAGAARGESLHNDLSRARLMVWTTGAVDYSQPETAREAKVVENDYHLLGKIDHSRALFAAAAHAGVPVLCVLPAGAEAAKAATVLGKVLGAQAHHVAVAASLADLLAPLEGFLRAGDFQALPENTQPLALYVAPAKREDRTASEDAAPAAKEPIMEPAKDESSESAGAAARPAPEPTIRAAAPPRQAPINQTPINQAAPKQAPSTPPPLAGAQPPPPYGAAATESRLPLGALIGVGVLALAIGGTWLALTGLGRNGAPPAAPAAALTQPSPQTAPPPAQRPAAQQAQPPAAPQPPAGPVIARLTLLAAPPGSSCQAQIYQMQPRFAETVVEVTADRDAIEIDGANLCGLAVTGATFQRGTGTAAVQSLSHPSRIVFAQTGQPLAAPSLTVAGGSVSRVEIKLK